MGAEVEGRTLGTYHILEQVGRGGMTTVYRALDLPRNRVVALKILSPYIAQDPNFKVRFEREIEVLRKLRHPKIVPILDYGEKNHLAYIVLPFFPKGTLQDRIGQAPLDPFEISRVARDIASALAFAHKHGVIHRDVKASNILLDENGNALLSDFGLARLSDLSISLTGSALIGTPAYMSPEQCKGVRVDERTDQYSLGIVLYQLFTGSLPFDGETPMAIAVQHINQPLPPPTKIKPDLPAPVESTLLKALAKDPDERHRSIGTMNQTLQGALRESVDAFGNFVPQVQRFNLSTWIMDRTPLGKPISTVNQWWTNRRPALLTALLLLLLLPTAGYAVAAMQITPTPGPRTESVGGSDTALQATIDALSTEIAASDGELDPQLVQAAVAATLSASSGTEREFPTATPTPFTVAGEGETTAFLSESTEPTATSGGGGDESGSPGEPTATGGPTESATSGASPTPSRTPGGGPTATSGPTYTQPAEVTNTPAPAPTNTQPPPTQPPPTQPPPTSTPKDVNPNACKSDPGHPNYCTPSP